MFLAESETAAGRLCRLPLSDADLERILSGGSEMIGTAMTKYERLLR